MKNNITKNLIVFGVIVFSLFFYTNNIFAYTCYGYVCDNGYSPSAPNANYNSNNPIYPETKATVVNNYYYPTKVAEASTVEKTSTTTEKTVTENKVTDNKLNSNNLTALSVRGSNGFIPNSVGQWILVIFLILAIVIIARIIAKKPAHNNPQVAPTH